jgi:two-component system, OmpR family, response regulator QseB
MRVLMLDAGLQSEAGFADLLATAVAARSIELNRVSNQLQLELALSHESIDGVLLVDAATEPVGHAADEMLQMLRARSELVIMVLTVAGAPAARRAAWFDRGVDDCMAQPIDIVEAAARLAAVLRRRGRATRPRHLRHGDLVLDRTNASVAYRGNVVALTPREATVLEVLIEHVGGVVSRETLRRALHGDVDVRGNTVEVYVHGLRQKLRPGLIRTVRGAGYRLVEVAVTSGGGR